MIDRNISIWRIVVDGCNAKVFIDGDVPVFQQVYPSSWNEKDVYASVSGMVKMSEVIAGRFAEGVHRDIERNEGGFG